MSNKLYNDWVSFSDKVLVESVGKFIKHHRLNQNISQSSLARDAGISRSTLSHFENGENISLMNLFAILRVLDLLNVMDVFEVNEEISPIEYAKIKKNRKQRARKKGVEKRDENHGDLEW